jgi:hypothetical protein
MGLSCFKAKNIGNMNMVERHTITYKTLLTRRKNSSTVYATASHSISHEMGLVVVVFLIPTVPKDWTSSQA